MIMGAVVMGAVGTMVRSVVVMGPAVRSMVVMMVLDLYDLHDVNVFVLRILMPVFVMMAVVVMTVRALDVHLNDLHLILVVLRTMVMMPTVRAVMVVVVGVMPVSVMLRLDLNIHLVRRTVVRAVVRMLMRSMHPMRMGMSVRMLRGIEVDLDDQGLRCV